MMKILYDRIYELETEVAGAKIMDSATIKKYNLIKHYREVLADLGLFDFYNSYKFNKEQTKCPEKELSAER